MDFFFREISERLQQQSLELGRSIEPQHKVLIAKSYDCMANCYRSPGPIEESGSCSETCHDTVQKVQNEIQQVVGNIQNYFQNCMQACKINHGKIDEQIRPCLTQGTDESVAKFAQGKKVCQDIINRYSS